MMIQRRWLVSLLALCIAAPLTAGESERLVDRYGDPLPAEAIARLGTVRFRPSDSVQHLSFSPDGKRIVTRGWRKIGLWDSESGKKLAEFASDKVGPIAWRSDGRGVMLVTEPGGKERIGDFTRERLKPSPPDKNYVSNGPQRTTDDNEQFHGHAISPNGRFLVAGRSGNRDEQPRPISVWEIDSSRPIEEFEQTHELGPQLGNCQQIVFSPEAKFVGIVSGPKADRTAKAQSLLFILYDLATGKERQRRNILAGRSRFLEATIALAPEGRYLAAVDNDSMCRIYSLEPDGAEMTVDQGAEAPSPSSWLAPLFAGNLLVAYRTSDSSLHFIEPKTGRERRAPVPVPSSVDAMALSPDGKRLAIALRGGIQIMDLATGQGLEPAAGHLSWLSGLYVFADGANALTWAWGHGDEPRLWELATGKELKRLPLPAPRGEWIVSPDEKAILALYGDKLRVFNAATGAALEVPGALGGATGKALNRGADRRSIVLSDDASVAVWDWPEGRLRTKIDLPPDPQLAKVKVPERYQTRQFHLTPDSKLLISRGLLDLSTWELETGIQGTLWRGNSIMFGDNALALVGDGSRIAFSGTFALPSTAKGMVGNDSDGPFRGFGKGGDFGGKGAKKAVEPQQFPAGGKKGKGKGGDDPIGFQGGFQGGFGQGGFGQGGFGQGGFFQADGGFKQTSRHGIALWELRTGRMLEMLEPSQSDSRNQTDIAPDSGGFVIAISEDYSDGPGALVLYEAATGQIRRRIFTGMHKTAALVFTPDGKRLVTAGHDTTALVWDVSFASAARSKKPATEPELDQAWKTLSELNSRAAYEAILTFASNPYAAVAFLKSQLHPTPVVGAATFDRIVADLDDEKFLTRERAANELEKLGRTGVVAIRARVAKAESREAKIRLTQFLEKYDTPKLTADELRSIRSLELLIQIANAEALALVNQLAQGEPTADLTIRARAVGAHLQRQSKLH